MRLHPIACLLAGGVVLSCSFTTDFDQYVGGAAPTFDAGRTGTEDCTNGVDDDGDGLADCADPKCGSAGYTCRAVPEGWQGPHVVASGTTPPGCAAPYGVPGLEGHDGLVTRAATCGCTCGAVTGATCYSNVFSRPSCGNGSTTVSPNVSLTCVNLAATTDTGVSNIGYGGVPGSCAVTIAPQEPIRWALTVRECGAEKEFPVGGCANSARCAPPSPSGFGRGTCITREGDHACPSEYPAKSTAYRGVTDDRQCTGCACNAPACPTLLSAFDGPNCTGGSIGITLSCKTFTPRSARVGDGSPRACTAVPGTASGTATPSQPTTICCSG